MSDGERLLRLAFKRLEQELPERLAAVSRWLRHPSSRLVRIPAALLLILGGIFSILPFLGLWMLPLGLMLIAADIPFLRKPMAAFAMRSVGLLERYRAWRAKR